MFQAPAIAAAPPPISHISRRNGGGAGVGGVDNAFDSIIMDDHDFHSDDEDGGATGGKTRNKSRRELPTGAVATLKAWLLSPEHFTHPYPTPQDQIMLMQKTGIDKKQLKNWFTNARRRIWKPMLKKQLEQGKLAATAGGGVVMPGLMMAGIPGAAPMPGQDHHLQYQQQGVQIQEVQVDQYGNPIYQQQTYLQSVAPAPGQTQYYDPNNSGAPVAAAHSTMAAMAQPLAAVPGVAASAANQQQMSKTDSHAVLMELFARDQDLVRQATESAAARKAAGEQQQGNISTQIGGSTTQGEPQPSQVASSQHPMKTASSNNRLPNVPTLNSWPHFSSVSSLNNLGTMPGVKSITSLSAADLAKQGQVNNAGNLAQVKSVESMGKNDSYAFLEVFFGDKSSSNLNGMGGGGKDQRGIKREREEDNEIGLSLEDESPSAVAGVGANVSSSAAASSSVGNNDGGSDNLKRAYDDAMAAQGLLHISRSSEKLTDLALPAKMQKSLSQEFVRQPLTYAASSTSAPAATLDLGPAPSDASQSHQYPAQPTAQSGQATSTAVQVPPQTKCALCGQTGVDTQLRPCGHMFHERCLKPLLEKKIPPSCPCDSVAIESALLAIPMENTASVQAQPKSWAAPPMQLGQPIDDNQ